MAKKKKKKFKKMPKPPCPFNRKVDLIDYKDVFRIKKFITTRGRMIPSQRTGVSPRCQRKLAREIKKARYMALLPFNRLV